MLSSTGVSWLRGGPLVAAITSVCASGFLLFGYDQGVMSGVVVSDIWLRAMGNPSQLMVGTITSLYDVGAFLGAIFAAFCAEPLGRKKTLVLGTVVLAVGSILMGTSFERIQFMLARVITGVGIGFITGTAPVYQSEISPAVQRGWQICAQTSTMLGGLMLAYIINYGMYFHDSDVQWRFPLLFQLVFALYIIVLTPILPDTPRWLMRHELSPIKGQEVLSKLRHMPTNDPIVQTEFDGIVKALELESREEGTWRDLFRDSGISADKRFYLALGIQLMQQLSGINIVTYYVPTLLKTSLGMSTRMSLLMGLLLQVFYFLASFVTWFTIDRVGRRKSWITCAIGMCLVLVFEAICVKVNNQSSNIGAVFFVFAFEAFFTWGWMATVWVAPPELLPLKIRAKGSALAAAADFLGNFLVVEVTPVGIANIGYRFYFIWAALNVCNAVIVFIFYPETANLPLEAIDLLFIDKLEASKMEHPEPFYRKFQWKVVGRAAIEQNKLKIARRTSQSTIHEHLVGVISDPTRASEERLDSARS